MDQNHFHHNIGPTWFYDLWGGESIFYKKLLYLGLTLDSVFHCQNDLILGELYNLSIRCMHNNTLHVSHVDLDSVDARPVDDFQMTFSPEFWRLPQCAHTMNNLHSKRSGKGYQDLFAIPCTFVIQLFLCTMNSINSGTPSPPSCVTRSVPLRVKVKTNKLNFPSL